MQFIFLIIVIVVVVIKNLGKLNGSSSSSSAANSRQQTESRTQQPSYRSATTARSAAPSSAGRYAASSNAGGFGRANYRQVGSANITRDGRVYASIDFDNTHYHAEGFDFDCCISFKGLPPGTDELAVLIASNNRHERELSKLLQERQS